MTGRYSTVGYDHVEYAFWLVFSTDGTMRFSRGQPTVHRTERAMACTAKLPRSLFKTPELRATIGISEAAPSSYHIDVEAAGEALRQAVGCDIDLRVIPAEEQS